MCIRDSVGTTSPGEMEGAACGPLGGLERAGADGHGPEHDDGTYGQVLQCRGEGLHEGCRGALAGPRPHEARLGEDDGAETEPGAEGVRQEVPQDRRVHAGPAGGESPGLSREPGQ
eukprot:10646811-Alexandrium_andersonii.AAC.1